MVPKELVSNLSLKEGHNFYGSHQGGVGLVGKMVKHVFFLV